MITADTITDEQIHELHARGLIGKKTLDRALGVRDAGERYTDESGRVRPVRFIYRARCAEILNARTRGSK